MTWYQWIALICLAVSLVSLLVHFIRLTRLGKPKDYSLPRGEISTAVRYAFSGAMNPLKKESAYLHLPTYTAGIFYHVGTFLCIILFITNMLGITIPYWISLVLGAFLVVAAFSGLGIFIKRLLKDELRHLSNPDDYISNLLVTIFQVLSGMVLFLDVMQPAYFIWASLLILYIPVGKLRHLLYFFAARYHLGIFYGWRGVWPPDNI